VINFELLVADIRSAKSVASQPLNDLILIPSGAETRRSAAEIVDKLPPQPAGVSSQPLPVALPVRSAPALFHTHDAQ
jgi:hypothetical protein